MRTLAIDPGTRRIGLALSDAAGRLATPLRVIPAGAEAVVHAQIAQIIRDEQVERIIVGLPLNMDDSVGPAARKVLAWSRRLADATGLTPLFVDERLSSFAAEGLLAERRRAGEKLTRHRKKHQRDALAAAAFLQEFLDGKLPALDTTRW